jgi:hypothetical protein
VTPKELNKSKRIQDVDEALTFRNHKGTSSKPALLQELVNEDVTHGFALPLPLSKIRNIKGVLLTPLNIQLHNTIDEIRRIILKDRMTHDQSFKWTASGTSVNSQVDKDRDWFSSCVVPNVAKKSLSGINPTGL